MFVKNVALVGASGSLGSVLLSKLLDAGSFNVTTIVREGSSFTPPTPAPAQLRVATVDKELSITSLMDVLRGQDAVIAAFRFADPAAHLRLAQAAASSGIKIFIPADFGSIDADNERARELVPLYRHKMAVRVRAQELTQEYPSFTWTAIVCGHFFEWGIKEGFFHTDQVNHKADIFDGGTHRASATTLTRVGDAVVRILQKYPDEQIRNRTLFIQSFCVDQNDLVKSLEKATNAQWTVNDLDSEAFIKEKKALADSGDKSAIEDLVFVIGTLDADWTQREDFAMELLGFEDEDLDETMKRVIAES